MKKTERLALIILTVLLISILGGKVNVKAGENFYEATVMGLNQKISFYLEMGYSDGEGPQYYKVKVKKTGIFTMKVNTKLSHLSIDVYDKNGNEKDCSTQIKASQGQAWIGDDYGTAVFLSSSKTHRIKGTVSYKLKPGTYYIRFRDTHYLSEYSKVTVDASFIKLKTSVNLRRGSSKNLSSIVNLKGIKTIRWKTSNKYICTMNSYCKLITKRKGKCTITLYLRGAAIKIKVTVK